MIKSSKSPNFFFKLQTYFPHETRLINRQPSVLQTKQTDESYTAFSEEMLRI